MPILHPWRRRRAVSRVGSRARTGAQTCSWQTSAPTTWVGRAPGKYAGPGFVPHATRCTAAVARTCMDLATIRLPDSLIAAPLLELWPVVVRRCEVPADVEQMVSRLQQPHNPAVERTVGSHSLAAAAHRERSAAATSRVAEPRESCRPWERT